MIYGYKLSARLKSPPFHSVRHHRKNNLIPSLLFWIFLGDPLMTENDIKVHFFLQSLWIWFISWGHVSYFADENCHGNIVWSDFSVVAYSWSLIRVSIQVNPIARESYPSSVHNKNMSLQKYSLIFKNKIIIFHTNFISISSNTFCVLKFCVSPL